MKYKKSQSSSIKEVENLFAQAQLVFKNDKSKANLLVKKARKLAMKSRTRLPNELKRKFCKHCNSFLIPSINSRIRIHDAKVIILCKECKKFTRIPIR